MSGCSTKQVTGDDLAAHKQVKAWAAAAGTLAAVLTYAELSSSAPIVLTGGAAALLVLAVGFAFLAGAALGFFIGFAANWFDRLHEQRPRTITVAGCIVCAGKNSGVQPFHDGDWTFNVADPFSHVRPNDA